MEIKQTADVDTSVQEPVQPLDRSNPILLVEPEDRDEDDASAPPELSNTIEDTLGAVPKGMKSVPRRLASDAARIQRLERLLNQSKKANADLRNQLQQLYRNDAIAQVGGAF